MEDKSRNYSATKRHDEGPLDLRRRRIILLEANPMSGVFRNIDHSPPGECAPPPSVREEDTVERGWGVNSSEDVTPDAALYSIYVSTLLP